MTCPKRFPRKPAQCLLLAALALCTRSGAAQTIDDFNPGANVGVYGLALQPDGKVLVAGGFTTIGGQTRKHIARLNPDGSVDTAFVDPNANGWAWVLAPLPDGRLLVGGEFSMVGGQARNNLARLNPGGDVDMGFAPNVSSPNMSSSVEAVALQPGGRIVVGGSFSTVAGQTRKQIARLNADGTLDTAFDPNAGNNSVWALALQSDGKIVVGGSFTTMGGQPRNRLARLNPDGSVDTAFNPVADNAVNALALQADGKIVAGGRFTAMNGEIRNYLARLNADGTLDTAFNPDANGGINALALQNDGKIVVGGGFSTIGGQTRHYLARLNAADGSADPSFADLNPNYPVQAIALQADGGIVVGGTFGTIGGKTRLYIARIAGSDVIFADGFGP